MWLKSCWLSSRPSSAFLLPVDNATPPDPELLVQLPGPPLSPCRPDRRGAQVVPTRCTGEHVSEAQARLARPSAALGYRGPLSGAQLVGALATCPAHRSGPSLPSWAPREGLGGARARSSRTALFTASPFRLHNPTKPLVAPTTLPAPQGLGCVDLTQPLDAHLATPSPRSTPTSDP